MKRVRVEIDLNSIRPDGTTRVRLRDFGAEIQTGQMVTAFESEDQVAADAWVSRIDRATGFAFIVVNRESMCDDDGKLDAISLHGSNRAHARAANERAAAKAESVNHAYAVHRATVASQ